MRQKPYIDWCPDPEPAAGPIDVVIPLGRGSRHDNAELRYCLRSVARFMNGLGRVWIVGERPGWLNVNGQWSVVRGQSSVATDNGPRTTDHGLIHLPVPDVCPIADVSIMHKLIVACLETPGRPRLSERFAFFSDDQLLLRPVGWAQLGPYHYGDLRLRTRWEGGWWQRMRHTRDWLAAREPAASRGAKPIWHGDTHAPLPMSRDEVLRVSRETDWRTPPGLCVGTLYLNWTLHGPRSTPRAPRPLGERKATIADRLPAAEVRRRVAGRWFLCHSDAGFTPELRALLDELFPEKCPFEE